MRWQLRTGQMSPLSDDTYLGREIVWRAAKRPSVRTTMLCETEVRNLDVAIVVEKDVLGLEVTINNVEGVHII